MTNEEIALSITGPCSCSEDYTKRAMALGRRFDDPSCIWHGYAEEIRAALDAKDAALAAEIEPLTRELESALERAAAADHLRPAYQDDAQEQRRLRIATEAERDRSRAEVERLSKVERAAKAHAGSTHPHFHRGVTRCRNCTETLEALVAALGGGAA